ncbi:hypothetical protein AVEN_196459-1 [Araneus ventricosus]|uniref:Uncharacterized protein n=1 Tax=Araneus ventricosus TaxID=182803 RepID=A0A4Y2AVB3_ARAVE|nr:hypothetical protein AVEN_196459-1 [Araneus ventricosus]
MQANSLLYWGKSTSECCCILWDACGERAPSKNTREFRLKLFRKQLWKEENCVFGEDLEAVVCHDLRNLANPSIVSLPTCQFEAHNVRQTTAMVIRHIFPSDQRNTTYDQTSE